MFSLIITIISIALVVALVAATMYYGGSALNQGTEKADAAAFVSGAQQITGAISLYKSLEGEHPNPEGKTGVDAIVLEVETVQAYKAGDTAGTPTGDKYLSAIPVAKGGGDWLLEGQNQLKHEVTSKAVCEQLKKNGGTLYSCAGTGATADSVGTAPFNFTFNY